MIHTREVCHKQTLLDKELLIKEWAACLNLAAICFTNWVDSENKWIFISKSLSQGLSAHRPEMNAQERQVLWFDWIIYKVA